MNNNTYKKKKIFFFEGNNDGTIGGSYYVLYDLLVSLDKNKYIPIVGFHKDNIFVSKFNEIGIETYLFPRRNIFEFSFKPFNALFFPIKKTVNVLRQLIFPVFEFRNFLKKQDIDLVNLNNSITRNHSWMIATLLSGTKCVTHEMGINNQYSSMSRFLAKKLDAIICVSYAVKSGMEKCGIFFPNIYVIQNGIDVNRYKIKCSKDDLRKKFNIKKNMPVVGVVGNVKQWKGQLTIIKAMAPLTKKYPNLRCMLVGDTSPEDQHYKDMLIELCNDLEITDNVIFTGFQNNIFDFMNLMDIVVHTSVDPEPFGIVLLEAMYCRKPLISTTIGGPAEIVVNGESGLLVEAGNPEELYTAIDYLLSDSEKAAQIGEAGYKRLESHFTMEKNVEQASAIYDRLLS